MSGPPVVLTQEALAQLVEDEVLRLTEDAFAMRVRGEVLGILKACGLDELMNLASGATKPN